MKINVRDKLLCRQTYYKNGNHIWQIGKYYEVISHSIYQFAGRDLYTIKSEQDHIVQKFGINSNSFKNWSRQELGIYFLIDKKKIRRKKLEKINKKLHETG